MRVVLGFPPSGNATTSRPSRPVSAALTTTSQHRSLPSTNGVFTCGGRWRTGPLSTGPTDCAVASLSLEAVEGGGPVASVSVGAAVEGAALDCKDSDT